MFLTDKLRAKIRKRVRNMKFTSRFFKMSANYLRDLSQRVIKTRE